LFVFNKSRLRGQVVDSLFKGDRVWMRGFSLTPVKGLCEDGNPAGDVEAEGHAEALIRPSARRCRRLRIRSRKMTSIEAVRELALSLPRSYEAVVRDRVKFRVGRIVYLSFSHDETLLGFAFPKEEREALVASEPEKFMLPKPSEMRWHWVVGRLDAIDDEEMRELVIEAWRMVVPKKVAAAHLGDEGRNVLEPRPPQ
jgi:hypothetical protein